MIEIDRGSDRILTSPGGIRRGALWSDFKGPYYIAMGSQGENGLVLSLQKEIEGEFRPYIRTSLPLNGEFDQRDHELDMRFTMDCSPLPDS